MIDTFHPLHLTKQASELEDDRYPYSWIPPEDGGEHARELVRAWTGGVPGLSARRAELRLAPRAVRCRPGVRSSPRRHYRPLLPIRTTMLHPVAAD